MIIVIGVHLAVAALWLGSMAYSLFVVQPRVGRLFSHELACLRADVGDARREGERGDLDAGVTQFGDKPALASPIPTFEQLLADGELHRCDFLNQMCGPRRDGKLCR